MVVVPGNVSRTAGVDLRDRRQLQLFGFTERTGESAGRRGRPTNDAMVRQAVEMGEREPGGCCTASGCRWEQEAAEAEAGGTGRRQAFGVDPNNADGDEMEMARVNAVDQESSIS